MTFRVLCLACLGAWCGWYLTEHPDALRWWWAVTLLAWLGLWWPVLRRSR